MSKVERKAVENGSKGEIVSIYCIECKRPTRHLVAVSLDKDGRETDERDRWSIEWSDRYQIAECQGCETVSFRHQNWLSEQQDFEDDGTTERLYPLRNKDALSTKPYHNVPTSLRRIYSELIDCFNNDSPTLCAAGLRALVEGICAQQGIVDGPVDMPAKGGGMQAVRRKDLEGRISGLQERGLLTKSGAQTLQEHRYLGNFALHELTRPSSEALKLAVEIVEHILDQLYEMPEKAADLRQAIHRQNKRE